MAHEGIADLLNEQGSELDKLSSELIKSYQKELELLAKIQDQLARIQAQEEALEQLKRRENEARTEALRARQHLRVLQNSPLGRLQRKYWQLNRKGKR
ncbi:hypothetical protein [Rothia halotolerans]|uniref:hypothetical protein n=1 Tax=Rothia halotolerans TaxID=405770 RepID=UPI00101D9826|nr:hypothetical protein [Rothia halotolerans]